MKKLDVPVCQTEQSDFRSVHNAKICSAEPSSTNLDVPVSETGRSRISGILDESSETTTADPDDWRTPLVRYLENPIILLIGKFGGKFKICHA
jgi:hypothetical protein